MKAAVQTFAWIALGAFGLASASQARQERLERDQIAAVAPAKVVHLAKYP